MEVYGITYCHTANYGTCLQAYALQAAVEKLRIGGQPCRYKLIPISQMEGYPRTGAAIDVGRLIRYVMHIPFRGFERRLNYAPLKSIDELYAHGGRDADAYVCGGDVIWDPRVNKKVTAYYLDFAQKYAFSYAPSFGKSTFDREALGQYAQYLSRLDQISVREESGRAIAQELSGKPVRVVCDPVLLLDREEWETVIPPASGGKGHIFVYTTHMNPALDSFVDRLSRQTHLKVVRIAWAGSSKKLLKQGILSIQSPEKWLQLLRDAEYVVTNSFHGTAFSLMFHKRFFTVVRGRRDEGSNVRMNDLLIRVGLEDRIFEDIPEQIDLGEVDYAGADGKLRAFRDESLAFLRGNLEAACGRRTGE